MIVNERASFFFLVFIFFPIPFSRPFALLPDAVWQGQGRYVGSPPIRDARQGIVCVLASGVCGGQHTKLSRVLVFVSMGLLSDGFFFSYVQDLMGSILSYSGRNGFAILERD